MGNSKVVVGDCLETLRGMGDASIDAIVTDPPYGLSNHTPKHVAAALTAWLAGDVYKHKGKGFMGRSWDSFVPGPELWRECLRVLKPGGWMACFASARTQHLMGISIHIAGFDIVDCPDWIYGEGMTKGPEVGKTIDKKLGQVRAKTGERKLTGSAALSTQEKGGTYAAGTDSRGVPPKIVDVTAPASDLAKKYDGWRTRLRPSKEPIILAQKPFKGTLGENIINWGTGALNAPGCSHDDDGSLPANVLFDEDAAAILDQQSGPRKRMSGGGKHRAGYDGDTIAGGGCDSQMKKTQVPGAGASQFFYVGKAQRKEREAGLEHLPPKKRNDGRKKDIDNPYLRQSERRNHHPTVKPIALMRWLVRLVTPPGGCIVLDPFVGSGTTGCAAALEGVDFVGCELSEEYAEIARARIKHHAP